jgi:vancomycin permeability regulator SanA
MEKAEIIQEHKLILIAQLFSCNTAIFKAAHIIPLEVHLGAVQYVLVK